MAVFYYSKTTKGFYNSSVHPREQIPSDAVIIASAQYDALIADQAGGKQICENSSGYPVAAERTITEAERLIILKNNAQGALNRSDITILRCIENSVTVPEAWQAYRQELRDIVSGASTATTLPERPDYPEGT